jgi:hypothetical protein
MNLFSNISLVAAAVLSSQSGSLLRRDLKAGSTDVYDVKCSTTTVPGAGAPGEPRTIKATWTAAYKVGRAQANGPATLEVNTTDFEVGGPGIRFAAGPPPKTRNVKCSLDPRNRINPKSSESSTFQWLLADFIELPERQVRIGDTWNVTLPESNFIGQSKTTLKAKLVGEQAVGGRKAWVVAIEGKNVPSHQKVQIRMGGMSGDAKEATISGKVDVSIKALSWKRAPAAPCQ